MLLCAVFKSLRASWLIDTYNRMTSKDGRNVIANGWKAAGIIEAISNSLIGLENLDPFGSLDLLVQSSGAIIDQSKQEVNLNQREDLATNVYRK